MNDLREAELRGNVPKRLLQLIDALQQARGHTNRMDVVIPVLEAYVERELHAATLLVRMARGNPDDSESGTEETSLPRLGVGPLRTRGAA